MLFRSLGLLSFLLMLVLLVALTLPGLAPREGFEERERAFDSAAEDALRFARLISIQQDRFVEDAHQLLLTLARLPAVRYTDPREGTVLTLFDLEGAVLARYHDPGQWVDSQTTVRAIITGRGEGTFEVRGLDGIQWLVAFSQLASAPLRNVYASVGITRSMLVARDNEDPKEARIVPGVVTMLGFWAAGTMLIRHSTPMFVGRTRGIWGTAR